MTRIWTSCAAFLALISGQPACAGDEDDSDERARWESSKPARYVVQTCTMGLDPSGCVRAAIEDGEAVEAEDRVFAAGVGWEPVETPGDPIEDMFDEVRDGDVDDCKLDDVTYDRTLGFVESYALVCDGEILGGRWVACFEPDTVDLERCDVVPAM
jgi:hypothetical protein